ncbi:hypothetical protein CHY_1191 [Carboxydothermus hydrogenoformans Z-2901]|uniref:Uncharacterized protein n=1 Tax=Carboxydothermus hydrogenoformans (strain ATCC BAA-161 / DSM 6008 / Z-2901) TaxID=246194 RepID=Q3ACU8_CARHZ|nr:hypothetical protein CHY_1191 [Carboxydothermus hydrogenoformans Z-2901]
MAKGERGNKKHPKVHTVKSNVSKAVERWGRDTTTEGIM